MTDPKHLDALVERLWHGEVTLSTVAAAAAEAITALRAENDRLSNLWQIEHDHATGLRAQIDRERAATIEAAARACEAVASNWSCGHMPPYCDCARDVEQWQFAADEVRALHTDATRAAMDAIRREGYEAGVKEAGKQRCVNIDGTTFRYETVDLRNPRLAVSVPLYATTSPDPDEVEF